MDTTICGHAGTCLTRRIDMGAGARLAADLTLRFYFFAVAVFVLLALLPFLSKRSNTAATISGKPTVASTNTSPKRPPSAGGTNFPHDTASLYGTA